METNKIYRVASYIDNIDDSWYVELETEDYSYAVAKAHELVSQPHPVVGEQLVVELLEVTISEDGSEDVEILDTLYNVTPLPNDDNMVVATVSWHMHPNYAIDIHDLELLKNTNYHTYSELTRDPDLSFRPFEMLLTVDELVEYYNAVKSGEWSKAPHSLKKVHKGFHVVESFLEELGLITLNNKDMQEELCE
jgi:hypothetical protein